MTASVNYTAPCEHAAQIKVRTVTRPAQGCDECMKIGAHWVQLRECLSCGHVGCCDSSANRHATAHFLETGHPIVTSAEPGETWAYCYVHHRVL